MNNDKKDAFDASLQLVGTGNCPVQSFRNVLTPVRTIAIQECLILSKLTLRSNLTLRLMQY